MSPSDSRILSVLATAVVVSGMTAAATTYLLSHAGPVPPNAAPPATAGDAPWPEVVASIDALRREHQDLRQRLAALENRPPTIVRAPAAAATPETDDVASIGDARSPQKPRGAPLPQRHEFQQQVAEALTSIRKAEAIEKVQKATEARSSRLEQRLSTLTERLGLDAYQVNEMRTILATRDERDQSLIRMWEAGVDGSVLGQTKRSHADEFQTAVSRVLTPAQLETWQSERDRVDK